MGINWKQQCFRLFCLCIKTTSFNCDIMHHIDGGSSPYSITV